MALRFSKETALIAFLVLVVVAGGMDVVLDLSHGAPASHIVKEVFIVLGSALLVAWLLFEQRRQAAAIKTLQQELAQAGQPKALMSEYVQDARKQLSEVIAHQFDDWKLTASEKEVGWLLLKGLSLREIAAIRDTLEKTVRQQASDIYKKAGLSGRHAFSAWFIEDLF